MKKLANLLGVKVLDRLEQKFIKGSEANTIPCQTDADCAHVCGWCTPFDICIYPTNGCS